MIAPVAVTGTGPHVNSFGLISDGIVPAEGTVWTSASNVWWLGFDTTITLDLGYKYRVNDLLASVDNNDRYELEYSLDGSHFTHLFSILPSYGEIAVSPGGMDTMSTDKTSSEYVSEIDFFPIITRYLRIRATPGGDALNAVGELRAFGSPVPESSTYGLIGATALTGLAAIRRRR